MKKVIVIFGGLVALAGTFLAWRFFDDEAILTFFRNEQEPRSSNGAAPQVEAVAIDLDTPWGVVFLPDKSLLVTERPGRVRLIDSAGNLQASAVDNPLKVKEIGEGGLLGITLHPDFSVNNYIYLYYTYEGAGDDTKNRVVRMIYQNGRLTEGRVIVDEIPGSANHNGGRIKFGPDGYLYITTGDAGNPSEAQKTDALGGKILRVDDAGQPVPDNPFGNLVYSFGHRNPQGLAWSGDGELWSTEHGRSGILSGFDELNLIEKGKNYGWPTIQGDEMKTGLEPPKIHSGSSTTWAPAGAVFVGDSLFFAGLRGQALYEAKIEENKITRKEHFKEQFGRIRDVVLGPDGYLYITTSNRDGRGSPESSDDKILRVNPQEL